MRQRTAEEYLVQATIEALREEWEAKGYQVADRSALGGIDADLILRRNGETVVFEVTTSASLGRAAVSSPKVAEQVLRNPNTSYHLVVTNPPRERTIRIEDLEQVLHDYLTANPPIELTRLFPHLFVGNVERSDITSISIKHGEIQAVGSAAVTIRFDRTTGDTLANTDDGVAHATLPFEFDVTLNSNLAIVKVDRLQVDTSEFDDVGI
jgi:hypothetical protein